MIELFSFLIVLIALLIGSYTDIKVREVPDYVSFLLIAAGLGIGVIKSLVLLSFYPVISSLLGFGVAFLISLLMFYTGQWGGGDAKILMGVGSVVGVSLSFQSFSNFLLNDFFISFLFNTILIGAFYGLVWGLVLGFINRKKLFVEISKLYNTSLIRRLKIISLIVCLILIITILLMDFLKSVMVSLIFIVFAMFSMIYIWIYVKAVEKVCMVKRVNPEVLTEGDWVVDDVIINNKFVAGKKDLGVSKEQIKKLITYYNQGKIKFVTIKTGIPFIPSFLLGFLTTYYVGNVLIYFLTL